MANKAKKSTNNKNMMYGLCAAIIVVIIVIVVAVFATKNKPLDESFFVSDNTKYVATMDNDISSNDSEYPPVKMHIVYFYSDNSITDLKMYYEYEDEETAKKSAEYLKTQSEDDDLKNAVTNGKYVIVTAPKSAYEEMTAEDAKQQVELLEMLQNSNFNDIDEAEIDTDVEVTE